MKRLWVAGALFAFVLFCAFYGKYTVNKSLSQLEQTVKQLEQAAGRVENTAELVQTLSRQWQKHSRTLSIWLAHEHVEQVGEQIGLIQYYQDSGKVQEIPPCCRLCRVYFEDMRSAQLPKAENIF